MVNNLHTSLGLKLRFRSCLLKQSINLVYRVWTARHYRIAIEEVGAYGCGKIPLWWLRQFGARGPNTQNNDSLHSLLAWATKTPTYAIAFTSCSRRCTCKFFSFFASFEFSRLKKALGCTFNGCKWCNVYFFGVFLHLTNILFFLQVRFTYYVYLISCALGK